MEIVFLRQAHKFIKNAHPHLKEKLRKEVLTIKQNPKVGKLLKGKKLKSIRSHRFTHQQSHYRIAYKIENNLLIISIATRENFYKKLSL